jgi:hypothetical protein
VFKQRQIAPLLVLSLLSVPGCSDSDQSESPTPTTNLIGEADVGTQKVGYFTFAPSRN